MELILKEIERALDAKLYYLALQASLTLPDICGALQSDDGVAKNYKYIAWYDKRTGRSIYFRQGLLPFPLFICASSTNHT